MPLVSAHLRAQDFEMRIKKYLASAAYETLSKFLVGVSLVALAAGCTIYKSPQRDSFDTSAKDHPASQKASPSIADWDPCAAISSESLGLLFSAPHLDLIRHHEADSASCTIVATDAPHLTTWRASCLLREAKNPPLSEAFDLVQPGVAGLIHLPNGESWACEAELNAEQSEVPAGSPEFDTFRSHFREFTSRSLQRLNR